MATYDGPYEVNAMVKSFTRTYHKQPYPEISPSRPELSAAGKVVFITGGGSGIGKATAIAFAQAGAKVVAIFGRRIGNLLSAAEEISKANPAGNTTVVTEGVDISQRPALEAAFANAVNKAGGAKVDIFINNAGVLQPRNPLTKFAEKELRDGIEGNLIGSFNAVQIVAPLLAPKAKILNISSGLAHINPFPGFWAYSALKVAIVKMVDYLEVENPHLTVFNIHPGTIGTDMASVGFPDPQEAPEYEDVMLPAYFNVWIASPEAEFLKGKFIWANWDVTELKALAKEIEESMLLRVCLNGVPV